MGDSAIARRLNGEGASLSPKCVNGQWTPCAVKILLENGRYIGNWAYRESETIWQSEKNYGRQFAMERIVGGGVLPEAGFAGAWVLLVAKGTGAARCGRRSETPATFPFVLNHSLELL